MPGRGRSWAQVAPGVRAMLGHLPQTTLAVRCARRLTNRRLRILAFHGVDDVSAFDRLVAAVLRQYQPVTEDDVAAVIEHGRELPDFPVWFTFDDGLRSTLDAGEMLAGHGVRATAFVCPAVIGEPRRLWFQVAAEAHKRGTFRAPTGGMPQPRDLKTLPDDERRRLIDMMDGEIPPVDLRSIIQVADLEKWRSQGHSVGNHTWDHPCLDTCAITEQRNQVVRAHDALSRWGMRPKFLAYPNGNYASEAAAQAQELGYVGSLLFDHALCGDMASLPHQISRLRIDSDATSRRALSILSGAHSAAHHLVFSKGRTAKGSTSALS